MSRIRVLIKMQSADAFELKAQALNNDPRLKEAGVAALKFIGDKKFISDGEFSLDLTAPTAPETAAPSSDSASAPSKIGKRLSVIVRIVSADAFELKAQALNNDPRLKRAGIAALKFVGDKKFISNGEFSQEPPSQSTAQEIPTPKPGSTSGERLRVVVRMANKDAYEMKAQALNDDPRLKEAGISALKFVGDKQYISGGEFSPERVPALDKKVRVTLKMPRKDAYQLVAKHLNHDPELAKLGIKDVGLAKGAGMVPVVKEPSARPPKKKRSILRYIVATVIVGVLGVTGAGALFFSKPPAPTPTTVALIPVAGKPTNTDTPIPPTETLVPATFTKVVSTKTKLPTATNTSLPTPTVMSCQIPSEATVVAENLSCRYGPGAVYLYRTGLLKGDVVDILGRQDTAYGTWIRVQTRWDEPVKCWVNSGGNYVGISQGDVACLDSLYPEKAPLIIFNTDLFPKPTNVEASRSGDVVSIQWEGYDLLPGDKPDQSPRYLVELWTCQDGKIVFTPYGTDETFAQVKDEAGCDEPSHGQVFLAHVDGYIGPSYIPWPP